LALVGLVYVEMVFVPMLHSVAPLGAIVELDRHGVILLLQYLLHNQLYHVLGVNVEMAFVPKLACAVQYGDIVELELNIVLVVNFMAMKIKNEVLMFKCRVLDCNILTGGDENYLKK
jgi:hypothetical protein